MEVLRRCPLAIAQRLVHCAIALSTAVLDRVTKTMSVAPLLTNNLDNSKQKTSNLLSPAPPPYSWSLLGKSEGPAPPPSSKISWSFDLAWNPDIFSLLSFSFLIGWEFYGPSYLKCQNLCAGPPASSFPQCPCSSRSSVSSSCCLCIWFRGEPTLFHVGANKSYVIATSTVPEEWDPPSWAGWPTSWFLWTADFAHLTSARCPKRGQGLHQQLREVHCGAMF